MAVKSMHWNLNCKLNSKIDWRSERGSECEWTAIRHFCFVNIIGTIKHQLSEGVEWNLSLIQHNCRTQNFLDSILNTEPTKPRMKLMNCVCSRRYANKVWHIHTIRNECDNLRRDSNERNPKIERKCKWRNDGLDVECSMRTSTYGWSTFTVSCVSLLLVVCTLLNAN